LSYKNDGKNTTSTLLGQIRLLTLGGVHVMVDEWKLCWLLVVVVAVFVVVAAVVVDIIALLAQL